MSNSKMIAYVAIHETVNRATFAYLSNTNITLPKGWKWNIVGGRIEEEDISDVAARMRLTSVDKVCRVMCRDTGVEW